MDPESFEQALEAVPSHLHERPIIRLEVDSSPRRVFEMTFFPVEMSSSETWLGALMRDITEAAEIDRLKSEFIGLASHELRTPLTGILGYAELLRDRVSADDADAAQWAERLVDEARRLTAITDDLLNVSRIESGRIDVSLTDVDLAPLLEELVATTGPQSGDHHRIELEISGRLSVHADDGKLREIVINLIENAIKYSPSGGTIRVTAETDAGGVRCSVSDEGVGIPASELPRLFDRFYRVKHADSARIRGTGLGLYIVREFVEAMNGTVQVESTPGRGSVFSVILPAASSRAAA